MDDMTTDKLRTRLSELADEYSANKKMKRQILTDIDTLDSIMARNFDAYWDVNEQCYTQEIM